MDKQSVSPNAKVSPRYLNSTPSLNSSYLSNEAHTRLMHISPNQKTTPLISNM